MTSITDNQYLGNITYYKNLFKSEYIELEQYEQHLKSGFRNRCYIAGANGLITLSIPLLAGRNQKALSGNVEIDNRQKWQIKHWRALESSYNRSPWFQFYKDELYIYYATEYQYLFDWNEALLLIILKWLEWEGSVKRTVNYNTVYANDIYIDSRNIVNPKNYLQFPHVKYPQVFEEKLGFLPNLSIIDLLFCCGKPGKAYFS